MGGVFRGEAVRAILWLMIDKAGAELQSYVLALAGDDWNR